MRTERRRTLTYVLVAGIAVIAAWYVVGALFPRNDAQTLFREVQAGGGKKLQARREAAERLARRADSGDLVAKLLEDEQTLSQFPHDMPEERKERLRTFERAVKAALIENLPADSSAKVLLAVTACLDDANDGRFSEERGFLITLIYADGITPPIRDVARAKLVQCLKVDHGYDANAWRAAILPEAAATAPSPPSSPPPPAATSPARPAGRP